jgi:hypothetical protein
MKNDLSSVKLKFQQHFYEHKCLLQWGLIVISRTKTMQRDAKQSNDLRMT